MLVFFRTVVPAQAIQIAAHGDGTGQGLQTLTMSNATQAPGSGATIVQYAQDGQFFIPGKITFMLCQIKQHWFVW